MWLHQVSLHVLKAVSRDSMLKMVSNCGEVTEAHYTAKKRWFFNLDKVISVAAE